VKRKRQERLKEAPAIKQAFSLKEEQLPVNLFIAERQEFIKVFSDGIASMHKCEGTDYYLVHTSKYVPGHVGRFEFTCIKSTKKQVDYRPCLFKDYFEMGATKDVHLSIESEGNTKDRMLISSEEAELTDIRDLIKSKEKMDSYLESLADMTEYLLINNEFVTNNYTNGVCFSTLGFHERGCIHLFASTDFARANKHYAGGKGKITQWEKQARDFLKQPEEVSVGGGGSKE
jgi:hypothetical protein